MRIGWMTTIVFAALIALSGCGEPDDNGDPPAESMEVTEHIDSDTTWEADYRYIVTGEFDVDARLTIEPGTYIEFEEGAGLEMQSGGILVADGTEDEPITFTGTEESPGWWNGLFFAGSDRADNILNHVVVEYAGADSLGGDTEDSAVIVGNPLGGSGAVAITNSTIRHSGGYGIVLPLGADLHDFESNTITDNADAPIRGGGIHLHHFDADSSYSGNGEDAVVVGLSGPSVNDHAVENEDGEWANLDVPYRIGVYTQLNNSVLTIEEGAKLRFDTDTGLSFDDGGGLDAVGSDDEPIVFTATEESPGWWEGLEFRESPRDNVVEHAVVEYAGADASGLADPANIMVGAGTGDANITVVDSTLRNSSEYGIWVGEDSSVNDDVCDVNDFSDNTAGDCSGSI